HLGQREPTDLAVVGGERPFLEHRVAEQVRGGGSNDHAGVRQCLAELRDALIALGAAGVEVEDVVVGEVAAGGAELSELAHSAIRGHRRPHGRSEYVHSLPADRPYTKRETVSRYRHEAGH